ncbi:MAG: preprotein translocase subunit YajC [Elusimicrobia bacterium]|nr:preprotein translocase subunit YajC [Elusimicrobiota bacterium]MBU2614809.1 preprotein translocase subunit YajC [Elusimicrobiota bacterium]
MEDLGGFLPLIMIFFIFYFLMIRPQQRKEKERKKMIAALKKGDKVVTAGGIYGTVTGIKIDIVELKIDDNAKIQLKKSAISQVIADNKPDSSSLQTNDQNKQGTEKKC